MFAVVEIGGRQYKVTQNEVIEVEKLDSEAGNSINFDKILLVSEDDGKDLKVGQPYVDGASVTAKVVENFKAPKIIVHKFIAKKRHSKTNGHRQNLTRLEITAIKA
jgi:large subunit ribosomal protein L21